MELSELAAYAGSKYHIREQHKWADLPGLSVLADPDTGRALALLMRQWDSGTGTEIQRCDMKCGREILRERPAPYLSLPFRMKGENWVGIDMEKCAEPEVVFRLLDRAVWLERQRGAAIILEDRQAPSPGSYKDTPLPFAGGKMRQGEIRRGLPERAEPIIPVMPEIPAKIREMMRLYEYRAESFEAKCRNFLRQARFMEDYEDNEPWDGEYRRFFPTYHDLNLRQLRGYFTWRTDVRRGIFKPFSASLAYIYLYELLNGVGAADAEDGLRKMQAFEKGFLDAGYGDAGIRRNLHRWMQDYAILNNVPPEVVRQYVEPLPEDKDQALIALKNPGEHTDEEILAALAALAGKRFQQSPVLGRADRKGETLFAALWRCASAQYAQDGKNLFAACFGRPRRYVWHPLANAVYAPPDKPPDTDYVWNSCRRYLCRGGVWMEERYEEIFYDKDCLHALLREADRQFRRYLKTGHYLREKQEEAWAAPFAKAVIDEDIKAQALAARPKITIDLAGLDRIRRDALVTRDNLLAGEEGEIPEVEEVLNSSVEIMPVTKMEMNAEQVTEDAPEILDTLHRQILLALLQGGSAAEIMRSRFLMPSVAADTINEAFFDEIGDNVVECEGDDIIFVEDYREEVEGIIGS